MVNKTFDDQEIPNLIERTFAPGEVILQEGESGSLAYKIISGKVEVTKKSGDSSVSLAILENNEIFGEISLIDDKPHSATVTAIDEVECICFPKEAFENELNGSSPIIQDIVRAFAGRLRGADERICATVDHFYLPRLE